MKSSTTKLLAVLLAVVILIIMTVGFVVLARSCGKTTAPSGTTGEPEATTSAPTATAVAPDGTTAYESSTSASDGTTSDTDTATALAPESTTVPESTTAPESTTEETSVESFSITWKTDTGATIDTTTVAYGTVPTHANPAKASTAQYDYTFTGWSPSVVAVTGNATYTAQFSQSVRNYTITWKTDTGATIDTTTVAYGTVPTHANPAKASTAQYDYTFTGWSPSVVAVTGNATYTAQFSQSVRNYTITWKTDTGATIDTTTVAYGTVPTHANPAKASTAQYDYTFTGWSPSVVAVTGNATYTAVFESYTAGLQFTETDGGTAYSVRTGTAKSGDVVIPSLYNGKPVTSIENSAFRNCSSLTSVTIPGSITSIGDNAFYFCSSLASVIIPDSVITIGADAFSYCLKLKSVTIGNGVTSIESNAFAYCALTSVTIPNSVTSIGEWAFTNCESLTKVIIPLSVTVIGKGAFYNCTSLAIIYCRAASMPEGWDPGWKYYISYVQWGYTGE